MRVGLCAQYESRVISPTNILKKDMLITKVFTKIIMRCLGLKNGFSHLSLE